MPHFLLCMDFFFQTLEWIQQHHILSMRHFHHYTIFLYDSFITEKRLAYQLVQIMFLFSYQLLSHFDPNFHFIPMNFKLVANMKILVLGEMLTEIIVITY